jgi:hypothetical protein
VPFTVKVEDFDFQTKNVNFGIRNFGIAKKRLFVSVAVVKQNSVGNNAALRKAEITIRCL